MENDSQEMGKFSPLLDTINFFKPTEDREGEREELGGEKEENRGWGEGRGRRNCLTTGRKETCLWLWI